jgi:hypothetical protein
MTISANEPTDQRTVSELPSYIRETREAVNAIEAGSAKVHTNLTVSIGTTSLDIDTDLSSASFETIKITGAGAITIASITGGQEGDVKIFIFQDDNINFTDSNDKASGKFYLNLLPVGDNFEAAQDDILALVNIGGDGSTVSGYWKELYRTISVK